MRYLILILFLNFWLISFAQKVTKPDYIERYKNIAISEMERTGIPASIKLAQGILESRYGNSQLSLESNNHFGMKCHKGWEGKKKYHWDDEKHKSCFRVYDTPEASYYAHSEFLMTRGRYSFLFEYSSTDYESWAKGLRKAGYATNPKYPQLLMKVIRENNLFIYDSMTSDENPVATNTNSNTNDNENDTQNNNTTVENTNNNNTTQQTATSSFKRKLIKVNGIKAVLVQVGDSPSKLSKIYDIDVRRISKYNDVSNSFTFKEKTQVFLQPKKKKGSKASHKLEHYETIAEISQLYGVKKKKLYKYNLISEGDELANGQRVYLQKKRKRKPKLRPRNFVPPAPVQEKPIVKEEPKPKIPKAVTPTPKPKEVVVQPTPKVKPVVHIPKESPKVIIPPSKKEYYTVIKGDTLYSLSRKHGVSVDALKSANNMLDNALSIGQKLVIP